MDILALVLGVVIGIVLLLLIGGLFVWAVSESASVKELTNEVENLKQQLQQARKVVSTDYEKKLAEAKAAAALATAKEQKSRERADVGERTATEAARTIFHAADAQVSKLLEDLTPLPDIPEGETVQDYLSKLKAISAEVKKRLALGVGPEVLDGVAQWVVQSFEAMNKVGEYRTRAVLLKEKTKWSAALVPDKLRLMLEGGRKAKEVYELYAAGYGFDPATDPKDLTGTFGLLTKCAVAAVLQEFVTENLPEAANYFNVYEYIKSLPPPDDVVDGEVVASLLPGGNGARKSGARRRKVSVPPPERDAPESEP